MRERENQNVFTWGCRTSLSLFWPLVSVQYFSSFTPDIPSFFNQKSISHFLNVSDVSHTSFFCTEDLTLIGHTHAVHLSFSGGHPKRDSLYNEGPEPPHV